MTLNDFKIGSRLMIGFAAVLLMMAALTTTGFLRLKSTEEALQTTIEIAQRAKLADAWLARTQLNVTRAVAIAKMQGQGALVSYFEPMMKATTDEISEIQKTLESTIVTERGKALIADVAEKRLVYLAARKKVGE